jgi:hypothetical protein
MIGLDSCEAHLAARIPAFLDKRMSGVYIIPRIKIIPDA